MTVKELIKRLSEYPDDAAQVLIPGDEPFDIAEVVRDAEQDHPTVFIVLASL